MTSNATRDMSDKFSSVYIEDDNKLSLVTASCGCCSEYFNDHCGFSWSVTMQSLSDYASRLRSKADKVDSFVRSHAGSSYVYDPDNNV